MRIVVSLVLGIALACLAMPAIHRAVPSDLSGTHRIVETLKSGDPRLVVFGDSRGMADIDAGLLGGVNLSTPDQSLADVVLLADQLPASVERVLIVVAPEDPGAPVQDVTDNALWMSGLRPSQTAKETVARCTGAAPFTRNEIEQRFAARWVLKQGLENVLRMRIHPLGDLYAERAGQAEFARELALSLSKEIQVTPEVRCLLAALAKPNVTFLVPPIHSAAARPEYTSFAKQVNVPILDFSRAMPDDAFADPRHLTRAAARELTMRLR